MHWRGIEVKIPLPPSPTQCRSSGIDKEKDFMIEEGVHPIICLKKQNGEKIIIFGGCLLVRFFKDIHQYNQVSDFVECRNGQTDQTSDLLILLGMTFLG